MDKKNINIIDIGKYTGSKSEIVGYEDGKITFTKDYKANNKYYYSINNYNVALDTVEEIYKYEIPEFEYTSQYYNVVGEYIIIIKMHLINRIEVDILYKNSKKLKSKHSFQVNEEVTFIPIIINNRYFIFYTDIDEMNTNEYMQYKERGYYHFLYLCDLEEDKIYFIDDLKIVKGLSVVHGLLDCLPTFIHNDQEYLIFNETYMEDYEYEQYIYEKIQANQLDKDSVTFSEALYLISIDDFAEAIKVGEKNIPFKAISKRYLDGWVRYLKIDEQNIYFREKDFKTQIEKIYAIDKENLKDTVVVAEINHNDIKGRVFYGNRIYEEIELDDDIKIRGLHNCNYDLCFKTDENVWLNEFISDRYLITSQWIEDEEENHLEFVYITDVKENNCIKYEGVCKIYNNCIIIYDHSGYWK